jgi:hypothetical protein
LDGIHIVWRGINVNLALIRAVNINEEQANR